jgi:hypothetical protein
VTRPGPIAAALLVGFALGFGAARGTAPAAPAPVASVGGAHTASLPVRRDFEPVRPGAASSPAAAPAVVSSVAGAEEPAKVGRARVSVRVPRALAAEKVRVRVDGNDVPWAHDGDLVAAPVGRDRSFSAHIERFDLDGERTISVPGDGSIVDVEIEIPSAPEILLDVLVPEEDAGYVTNIEGFYTAVIPTMPPESALEQGRSIPMAAPATERLAVEPGTWWVGVRRRGERRLQTATVTVGREPVLQVIHLPPLDRDEFLVVTTVGPDGQPMDGWVDGAIQNRGTGVYLCLRPTEPAEIFAYADGTGRRGVRVPAGAREATIQLTPGAFLDVTVEGYAGTLAEDVTTIEASGPGGSESVTAAPALRLGPFGPGPMRLDVTLPFRDGNHSIGILVVPAIVGETGGAARVVIPPLYAVTIQAPFAGTITLLPHGRMGEWDVGDTTPDRFLHLLRVPAGRYTVRVATSDRSAFFTLRIPGPPLARLEERAPIALRHYAGNHPRKGFLLEDGDLVVAVDGTPIEDEGFPEPMRVTPGQVHRFSVQRGPDALAVEATWYDFWHRTGTFRPVPLPE